ncbi:hypothetical Protein YC6258_04217 [Gynuella sunshinyii YC6258]|uniref:Uncharacterized protein n=1 Tax=Gynuella sunshinyii YC6258 TaxID=1445510 RepID=A0A0C5VNL5_9GAMM|nr:hypothetical Protein YC6258_04217 [Gynuella sunshinyii YC6258]
MNKPYKKQLRDYTRSSVRLIKSHKMATDEFQRKVSLMQQSAKKQRS